MTVSDPNRIVLKAQVLLDHDLFMLGLLVSFKNAKKQLAVEFILRLKVDKAIKHLVNSLTVHFVFKFIVTARFMDTWVNVLLVSKKVLLWLSQCTFDQGY